MTVLTKFELLIILHISLKNDVMFRFFREKNINYVPPNFVQAAR